MANDDDVFHDRFGFYSPMPLNRGARREPEADFPTGPGIGATLPDIVLPDQNGRLIDVRARGPRGAIVIFHRSAYW